MTAVRAVCYARVSSKKQRDAHTVESQLRTLPAFVSSQAGWTLARPAGHYVDDGRSAKAGKLEARDAFARLLRDAAAGEFDVVVIVDLDRLTRSEDITERGQIIGAFQRAHVKIAIAATGQILDLGSSMGDLLAGLQGYFAAEWGRKHRERISQGKLTAIARGRKPAGPTPYGLAYDRFGAGWSIDESPAAVVREIYARVVRGDTCEAIAGDLTDRGLRRPRGGEWTRERVWQIVKNPVYRGEWRADKAKRLVIPVPRLVDDATWHGAQDAMAAKGRRGPRTRHVYLLEALAVCELCQARVNIASAGGATRTPARYVCSLRLRPRHGCDACGLPPWKVAVADDRLWGAVSDLITGPEVLERALEMRRAEAAAGEKDWAADLRDFERKLERSRKAEVAILARFRRGVISEASLDAELDAGARERAMLERQVETARRAAAGAAAAGGRSAAASDLLARLRTMTRAVSPEERREILATLIDPGGIVMGAEAIRATVRVELPPLCLADAAGYSSVAETRGANAMEFRLVA